MIKIHLLLFSFILFACTSENDGNKKEVDEAQEIVDLAIEKSGGERFLKATIDFDFRKLHYRSEREGGKYTYYRVREDSTGKTEDILSNDGFIRKINGEEAFVHDTMAIKYSNSINSVIYFALLPYGLNDPAVNKEYLDKVELDNISYHKIKVTFDEEGGGEDFTDIFIYWINKDSLTIDYLAYEFFTEGGGQRFRKAINPRYVEGIRFVDYLNFKPVEEGMKIDNIDSLYKAEKLDKISEIILENIQVELKEN